MVSCERARSVTRRQDLQLYMRSVIEDPKNHEYKSCGESVCQIDDLSMISKHTLTTETALEKEVCSQPTTTSVYNRPLYYDHRKIGCSRNSWSKPISVSKSMCCVRLKI